MGGTDADGCRRKNTLSAFYGTHRGGHWYGVRQDRKTKAAACVREIAGNASMVRHLHKEAHGFPEVRANRRRWHDTLYWYSDPNFSMDSFSVYWRNITQLLCKHVVQPLGGQQPTQMVGIGQQNAIPKLNTLVL